MTDNEVEARWPQPYQLLDAQPYWAALDQQRLTFQHCDSCASVVWPAHSYCPECDSPSLSWRESAGRGRLYTWSTVWRGPTPVWDTIAPYTVGFVEMEEGYHLFTQIEADPDSLAVGDEMTIEFVRRGEQTLPVFTPAQGRR